jgi:hypothetical protein
MKNKVGGLTAHRSDQPPKKRSRMVTPPPSHFGLATATTDLL